MSKSDETVNFFLKTLLACPRANHLDSDLCFRAPIRGQQTTRFDIIKAIFANVKL